MQGTSRRLVNRVREGRRAPEHSVIGTAISAPGGNFRSTRKSRPPYQDCGRRVILPIKRPASENECDRDAKQQAFIRPGNSKK